MLLERTQQIACLVVLRPLGEGHRRPDKLEDFSRVELRLTEIDQKTRGPVSARQ